MPRWKLLAKLVQPVGRGGERMETISKARSSVYSSSLSEMHETNFFFLFIFSCTWLRPLGSLKFFSAFKPPFLSFSIYLQGHILIYRYY